MHLSTHISLTLNIPRSTPALTAAPGHSGTYSNTANRQEKTKFAHFCFYHRRVMKEGEERTAGRAVHWPRRALGLLWHEHPSAERSILRPPSCLWGGKITSLISCKSLLSLAGVKDFVREILVGVLWSVKHSKSLEGVSRTSCLLDTGKRFCLLQKFRSHQHGADHLYYCWGHVACPLDRLMSVQLTVCISILEATEILQIPEHKCALLQKSRWRCAKLQLLSCCPCKECPARKTGKYFMKEQR